MYRVMSFASRAKMDKLYLDKESVKEPGKNEVQIRVYRAGISMGDILAGDNSVQKIKKFPWIPGYDVTGLVLKVGKNVRNIKPGDRVTAFTEEGSYRECVNIHKKVVVPIPDELDYSVVSALNVNYVTAYQMMKRVAGVKKGQTLLVHSAAGGLGSAVVQLASLWDIKVYGTASSLKEQFVTSSGVRFIDYKKYDFTEVLKEEEPEGVDVVFETVGLDNALRSRKTLKKRGVLVLAGLLELNSSPLSFFSVIKKILSLILFNKGIKTVLFMAKPMKKAKMYREDLRTLLQYVLEKKIEPVIYDTFPLEKANEARELLLSGRVRGKLLLNCE